jgi:hypothetical protein
MADPNPGDVGDRIELSGLKDSWLYSEIARACALSISGTRDERHRQKREREDSGIAHGLG